MTAIFMVWNATGLAIASDRSASVSETDDTGNKRILFNDFESKIFRPKDKNFVVASAGEAGINGIPIHGILNQWNKTLEHQSSLFDYVFDFLDWYAKSSVLEKAAPDESTTTNYFSICLEHIQGALTKINDQEDLKIEQINKIFDGWEAANPPNIYGSKIQNIGFNFKVNGSNNSDEQEYLSFISRFNNYKLEDDLISDYETNLSKIFDILFLKIFGRNFNGNRGQDLLIKDRMLNFAYNFINDTWEFAELMFAGYGNHDWIPQAVKIRLYHFDQIIPWVVVTKVTNSDSVWYQFLGQNQTVSRFWGPINSLVREELNEALFKKFGNRNYYEKVLNEIDSVIASHSDDLLNPIRSKINVLNVNKLAFLAQQMVSLESFNSFIHEYLPTVGGDIDCVKLTRVDNEY